MAKHNRIGKNGERLATECLTAKGYTIRETNWKNGKYELDIVAQSEATLIIAEVKTRSTGQYEHPQEAVTPAKIRRTIDATDAYIRIFNIPLEVRFDVIAITGSEEDGYEIEHIEDAFYAPL